MTKPMNIEAIEKATGKNWNQWLEFFDAFGAKDLPHKDIAKAANEHLTELAGKQSGLINSPGWWAQNVTVAYEQYIGRRVPGQVADGTFEVSVTKTIDGSLDDAMRWWEDKVADMREFDSIDWASDPTTSSTDKWRHWRVNLADGGKVIVSTNQTKPGKALLAVTNQKLPSSEFAEQWRTYWKQFLSA